MGASCVPVAPIPIQLPNACGTAEDGTSIWAPVTHVGDPGGAPGCWLQPGLALAIVAIWGLNLQQVKDPPHTHTSSK